MKPKTRFVPSASKANLAFIAACSSLVAPLHATDYTWTGTTSNAYATTTNWSPNGSPGTGDNVLIDSSANNTTNVSGNWSLQGAGTTTISGTGVVNVSSGRFLNYGAFNMLGGQFNHTGEYFIAGNGGVGTVTHSGGTITSNVSRGWFLSDGGTTLGTTYTLSGGTLIVNSLASYNSTNTTDRKLRSVWFGKGGENTVASNVTGDTFKITTGTATFTRSTSGGTADVLISRNSKLLVEGGTISFANYSEFRIGHGYTVGDTNTYSLYGATATGANNNLVSVSGGTLNITGGTNVRVGFADAGTLQISNTGTVNLTGNLNVGSGGSTGTLTMTGGTLNITNTATDIIGGGNNGNATVTLSGNSILNAATTKWKTGDFGGSGTGTTTISLSDNASLTLKEFTIGHLGLAGSTETVTISDNAALTVNDFITIGRDDNTNKSAIVSVLNLNGGTLATKYIVKGSDDSDATKNYVNANGGTIKALAAESDFFKLGTYNAGRVYVNLASGGLTFDTNGFNVGIQNGLHGIGGLTKQGGGTLTLGGTSDYTGETVVNSGALVINGNITTSATIVNDGATLGGSGTLGTTIIMSGGTLAIGNSPGAMTFEGDLTLNGVTEMELGGLVQGSDYDYANITGILTLGGALNIVSYNGYDLALNAAYDLFDAGTVTGNFASVSVGGNSLSLVGDTWSSTVEGTTYSFSQTTGVLNVIPEPEAALLGAFGILFLLRRRRD